MTRVNVVVDDEHLRKLEKAVTIPTGIDQKTKRIARSAKTIRRLRNNSNLVTCHIF